MNRVIKNAGRMTFSLGGVLDSDCPAIADDGDQAFFVGAEYRGSVLFERLQGEGMRVSVAVVEAGRNDAECGAFEIEKRGCSRVRLPWWPTFRTSSCSSRPSAASSRSIFFSMSPVSRNEVEPKRTRMTSESSFFGTASGR